MGNTPGYRDENECSSQETTVAMPLEKLQKLTEHLDGRDWHLKQDWEPLFRAIKQERAKSPDGCTVLSLLGEVSKIAYAISEGWPKERVREQLLTLGAMVMRLYFGDVDDRRVICALEQIPSSRIARSLENL